MVAFDILCVTCVGGLPPSHLFLDLVKQAAPEAHLSLAANRHWTHYTL